MAIDATLTKTERNVVYAWVVDEKCEPTEFDWTTTERQEHTEYSHNYYAVSKLVHRPTKFYVVFGQHYLTLSPGQRSKVEDIEHEDNWNKRAWAVRNWLRSVRVEHEAPDLWDSISEEKRLSIAASSPQLDNRPFTPQEQNLIIHKLDEVKGYLLESQQFSAEQAENVERGFAYLRESSQRLGRKDWLNILLAGMVSLIVGLALDTEKARDLLRVAGVAFQSLWVVTQTYLR